MKHLLFLSLIALFLSACGPIVREVDFEPSTLIPEDAHPAPIKWSKIDFLLPPGSNVGREKSDNFCWTTGDPMKRSVIKDAVADRDAKQTFHDALESNGYDVVDSLAMIDEEAEDDAARAEYTVTAKVVDVDVDMCKSPQKEYYIFSRPNKGERGELYVAIDWTVWDPIKRSTALKVRTEGYTKRRLPNIEGLALMFDDAFEMAAHNLAADPQFYDLIVRGIKPDAPRRDVHEEGEGRPHRFDPMENVNLPPQTLSTQPFSRWAEEGRKAAVMVQKIGHGSGFFITKQGHILTSFDAVGNSSRTGIVTVDRKNRLYAEVLRVDKARNVALLKLEEIPPNFEITTLPIRAEWPKIGEDVYAIGVPKDWKYMTDTLTKGIVSAHRKNYKLFGVQNDFIQADVEIHKGSKGGPLLDEYGNVVGIAQGSYEEELVGHGIGLNYFIPIGEALDRLHIPAP